MGEVISLRWDDINFERKIVNVTKTFARYKSPSVSNITHDQSPKSQTSARQIPLCDDAINLLKEQKNSEYTSDTFVFLSVRKVPFQSEVLSVSLKRLIKKYNEKEAATAIKEERVPELLPMMTIHALRHTFATRCFEQGIPPKTVQCYLGHSTLKLTMDLYTHVSDEKMFDEIEKINGLL